MPVPLDEPSLALLQVARLKRTVDEETLMPLAGVEDRGALEALLERDLLRAEAGRLRLGEEAEEAVSAAIVAERAERDPAPLAAAYHRFEHHNASLKEIIVAWQVRQDQPGTPLNDHADPAYDAAVLTRLRELHAGFMPVAQEIVAIVPRLGAYPPRLQAALDQIDAGEQRFLASPLVDSYHTVWFELHEELLDAQGLSRRDEEARAT
jgi:pyruvate,orthophosphate dikinase